MNNNKKVIDLGLNTDPSYTDLSYVVQYGPGPSWADKKVQLRTLSDFTYLSRSEVKGGSYTVQESECDKRWFSNGYATGSTYFVLPLFSPTMEVGFFVEASHELAIYPQQFDTIYPLGALPGHGIKSSLAGSAVYLKYFTEGWLIISLSGTWVHTNPI